MDKKRGKLFVVISSACSRACFGAVPSGRSRARRLRRWSQGGLRRSSSPLVSGRNRSLRSRSSKRRSRVRSWRDLQVTDVTDLLTIIPGLMFRQYVLTIGDFSSPSGASARWPRSGCRFRRSRSASTAYRSPMASPSRPVCSTWHRVEVLKGPQALYYGKASLRRRDFAAYSGSHRAVRAHRAGRVMSSNPLPLSASLSFPVR